MNEPESLPVSAFTALDYELNTHENNDGILRVSTPMLPMAKEVGAREPRNRLGKNYSGTLDLTLCDDQRAPYYCYGERWPSTWRGNQIFCKHGFSIASYRTDGMSISADIFPTDTCVAWQCIKQLTGQRFRSKNPKGVRKVFLGKNSLARGIHHSSNIDSRQTETGP